MTPGGLIVRVGARLLRTRWFVRAPIGLYRIGLGRLFGSRLLLLEHRGRVSGRRRYVTLECVDRPDPDTVYVASGFGAASQWYRNVAADAHVRVSIGRVRDRAARADLLGAAESDRVLADYGRTHARALRELTAMVEAASAGHRADLRIVRLSFASA